MITQLRILPPLAIARLGASATPLANYDVEVDPQRPLGFRTLRPAPTLEVDPATGEITGEVVPEAIVFRDGDEVRPVAPFLEVWALTDAGVLEPLTTELLAADGADAADVRWRVQVANIKVARRTGAPGDRVAADTGEFAGHDSRPLTGTCPNFWPGRTVPFGEVRYIRPTAAFPQIRLRFTPAAGHVYGAATTAPSANPPDDENIVAVVYDANRGDWVGYTDTNPRTSTVPGSIFAVDDQGRSRGYLDDACDGFVRVRLELAGRTLSSYARIGSGPPTYAPDALPIRSVADELEQAMFGPTVDPAEVTPERVEEIVRRAFESIRLLNAPAMNQGGMAAHDTGFGRRREPIMAPALVDTVALEQLHQTLLAALRGGSAPWFADVLRAHDQVGDLSDRGRRRMPALMRGADGRHLTLTRRQIETIRALVRGPVFPDAETEQP